MIRNFIMNKFNRSPDQDPNQSFSSQEEEINKSLNTIGDEADFVDSFNTYFQKYDEKAENAEQILTAVRLSSEVEFWYYQYLEKKNFRDNQPQWINPDDTGLKNWSKLNKQLDNHEKRLADWNKQKITLISNLLKGLEGIKRDKLRYYKTIDPLLAIHSLTVENLPFSEMLEISSITDLGVRKRRQESLLLEFKKKQYQAYLDGKFKNPFDPVNQIIPKNEPNIIDIDVEVDINPDEEE